MQEFEEQERRLAVALRRLSAALERVTEAPPAGLMAGEGEMDSAAEVEIARLSSLLDAARAEKDQIVEQARAYTDQQANELELADAKIAALSSQVEAQGIEVQKLRAVNLQMREALRSLREALGGAVVDADQINRAMELEIETMRLARQSEAAELDGLLRSLEPLLGETAVTPEVEADMSVAEAAVEKTLGGADA